MNIHEYQSKAILKKYGVAVPRGGLANSAGIAGEIAQELGGSSWVVKAQIHAGGRGKGGGVRICKSIPEVVAVAKKMIGMKLITHQTGDQGKEVRKIYVEQACTIVREFYLSILLDRPKSRLVLMGSSEGGINIEEVAARNPEKIKAIAIDPSTGMLAYHARQIAFGLGLQGNQVKSAVKFFMSIYRAFIELDTSLLEVNPLVINKDNDLVALDAKMNFDDNAMFRHRDMEELRDEDEHDAAELEAQRHDLNYIKLDGSIGCMVNGAGLAMATMDIIKLYGGEPANFLDVGGSATKERVAAAFTIILSDSNVEGILVNIFGGIMRCDVIAEGVIAAAREVSLNVPLVVRLEGTNVELGKKILSQSGLPIVSGEDLADAAEKVIKAVKEAA